jgi:hypothetical protein
LIFIIALFNVSSAAGLLPPTLETTLSDNNLIFDKVLPVPSISIGIQRSAILEANFTTQFESNSSDASIDWALSSPAQCNYTLREARFDIFGYLTSWTNPMHRHYYELYRVYLFGNETGTLSSPSGRQVMTYHFGLGGPIREMQTAYSPYYPTNITIHKESIPVIIGAIVELSMNCGVQNSGYTYFADMKIANQLQTEPEIELSVPSDAAITFFSSNLVRLRPNVFWLPLTDSVQRFYVQYDLTPWYLLSPTRDFIVGTITGFLTAVAIPLLAWMVRSAHGWKSRRRERRPKESLDSYLQ